MSPFTLILFNFFSLVISLILVSRMRLTTSVRAIKVKTFLILGFLLYSSLFLILFNSNSDDSLLSLFAHHSYFELVQNKVLNELSFFGVCQQWSFVPTISLNLNWFFFNLFGNLDSLSVIFLFMSHIVSFMVILFSLIYFNFDNLNSDLKALNTFKLTLNSVLVMTIMMDFLFVTDNLLIIFFLAELSLIPLSFLITKDSTIFWHRFSYFNLKYENKRPLALYYLIFFTIVSGGFGFIGIIVVYLLFGTLSLNSLSLLNNINIEYISKLLLTSSVINIHSLVETSFLFSLLCLLFWISVKVPLAPVHVWLPKAHVEGSTESSMLLAGIILKVTVYVLLRMVSIPVYSILLDEYRAFLLSVAATTAVLGAFGSLLSTDMKRITAYSSVSHMGLILSAGFYLSSLSFALMPFLVLLLTHTVVSTAMFMIIGCIYKSRYGIFISRNRLAYGGLLFIFPIYFLFGSIIFANLNIPLTMGFVGEFGSLVVVLKSGLSLGIILCAASFILLLPMLMMFGQVLLGPLRLVDFFKLNSTVITSYFSNVNVFYKRLIFNKLVWNSSFVDFYLANRIYFSSIFIVVLGFGIFSFLFINFFEDSLIIFDMGLLKSSSF